MGSLKNMEPYWWETKPESLNEWLYKWRKNLYHRNPRYAYVKDYELARIAALEQELKEKLSRRKQAMAMR
ncbi:MAG: hypothetical protein QW717_04550 [Candidatus Bathyarchaeia archaeon]